MARKRFVQIILCGIVLLIVAFLLWMWKGKKTPITLPVLKRDVKTTYLDPAFSGDDRGVAFTKVRIEKTADVTRYGAEIWTFNIKGKPGKKSREIPLSDYQELLIKKLDFEGRKVTFQKKDYRESRSYDYLCSLEKGEYSEISSPGTVLDTEAGFKIVLEQSPSGKGRSLAVVRPEGRQEVIRRVDTTYESINNPRAGARGNVILFQIQTEKNRIYQNQLWQYSMKTMAMSLVAEDCMNVIASPADESVAYLIPLFRNADRQRSHEKWGLIVRSLNDAQDTSPLQESFNEDVELYSWSKDGKGFLFQKGTQLLYYDVAQEESRTLIDSKIDGWWGYPLSPYYVALSPDSKKVALLTYLISHDGRSLKERVIIIDIESSSRTVVHNEVMPNAKPQYHHRFSFHPRIIWSSSGEYMAFEGRNSKVPDLAEIYLLNIRKENKKNLSKGFLGIFYL